MEETNALKDCETREISRFDGATKTSWENFVLRFRYIYEVCAKSRKIINSAGEVIVVPVLSRRAAETFHSREERQRRRATPDRSWPAILRTNESPRTSSHYKLRRYFFDVLYV